MKVIYGVRKYSSQNWNSKVFGICCNWVREHRNVQKEEKLDLIPFPHHSQNYCLVLLRIPWDYEVFMLVTLKLQNSEYKYCLTSWTWFMQVKSLILYRQPIGNTGSLKRVSTNLSLRSEQHDENSQTCMKELKIQVDETRPKASNYEKLLLLKEADGISSYLERWLDCIACCIFCWY